jgi:hypothetical protein
LCWSFGNGLFISQIFITFVGFPAEQTVYLVNEEEKAFSFSFNEDSCYAEAHAAQLFVEPMSGSIPAKSR